MALPLTRADSFASVTVPVISVPFGNAVLPDTITGAASAPRTGSSIWLVFEPSVLSTLTLSAVPAGIVTSRNFGSGGGSGLGAAAGAGGAAAGAAAAAGLAVGAGVWAAGVDGGGEAGASAALGWGAPALGAAFEAAGGAAAGSAGGGAAGCGAGAGAWLAAGACCEAGGCEHAAATPSTTASISGSCQRRMVMTSPSPDERGVLTSAESA